MVNNEGIFTSLTKSISIQCGVDLHTSRFNNERSIIMGFLFNQVFWGVMLILLGIAVIIKVVFQVNIPLGRLFFAFILIYIGIWFLMGGKWSCPIQGNGNTVIFNESQINITQPSNEEYNVIFSRGIMDFTGVVLKSEGVTRFQVNTIFGSGVIKLNPDIPAKIIFDSPFASVQLPNGNNITFGTNYAYTTPSFQENQGHLLIKAVVVFGSLEIIENR